MDFDEPVRDFCELIYWPSVYIVVNALIITLFQLLCEVMLDGH
jgi:hypothetical protein